MARTWPLALGVAFVGCAAGPEPIDYTGDSHRFVVDSVQLPRNNTEARAFGLDLDGDGRIDNQLGMVIYTLASIGDITTHGQDMIASGAIASSVELVADDLATDPTVAVRYFGADGEHAELVGGALKDGGFATATAGSAIIHLPVFVDADPIVMRLTHTRIALAADGHGGFDATIGGAIMADEARGAAFASVHQMLSTRPIDHVGFFRWLDTDPQDFVLTQHEFEANTLVAALLAADLQLDGGPMLSIGFAVHLTPCAAGTCISAPVTSCFDRVRDGGETDVDCGGSCGACAGGAACGSGADCQSGSCTGTCAEASCTDGVRDGFETDVDCGTGCGPCTVGEACWSNADCVTGQCGAPCSGTLCGDYTLDVCR